MSQRAVRVGLRTKLVLLLLGFGVGPVGAAITVGYVVSRTIVTERAEAALREVAEGQALHLATELSRQRLLLRTIAGQLPPEPALVRTSARALSRLLVQSLPEGGVFDGLRVATAGGDILARVALRNTAPQWPAKVPAGDWTRSRIVVHRDGPRVLAYLVAVPIGETTAPVWLEGHVRAEDFSRVFAIPAHLMGGAESGIIDRQGRPILVARVHAVEALRTALRLSVGDSAAVVRIDAGDTPSLIATASVPESDWFLSATLPVEIALAPLEQLRNTAVAGAGVLAVLIVLIGVWAARSVTGSLNQLTAATRRFGQAGPFPRIPSRSADEVGELVEAFNRMADDLENSRLEIERLHAGELERAQQLATVGELASGVAHEIRNPVTGVLGALELALRSIAEGDPSRPLLEEAQVQLKRIEGTTSQLLRYARPPELREMCVDANLLVDRAARVVEPQALSAGVALTIEGSATQAPVRVDPELMVQVLVNLMLNGIEAMGDGSQMTVWVGRHAPEVWIGVRDTGPGVAPEIRSEIFRPFFTTKHHGTGLGLSISHQIVRRHGGSLRMEDTPGGGATFVVAMPLAEEDEGNHEER